MKTAAILLVTVFVGVSPDRAAVGETITVSGPPGAAVALEGLDTPDRAALGRTDGSGTLVVRVPDVPHGRYRVTTAGASESPVLEVLPLSQDTSLLLLGFGVLLVVGLGVAAIVVHRRWRDAVS